MSKPILVDTDVLVEYLRGNSRAVDFILRESTRIILSSVTVAELYADVKGDEEMNVLNNFISLFRIVPVSPEIGQKGGLYKCYYAKSHSVGLADAIMAATSDTENAELKTLNVKHYPMFKSLKPAYEKTREN